VVVGLAGMVQVEPVVREVPVVEEEAALFTFMTRDTHQTMAAFQIRRISLEVLKWMEQGILLMGMADIRDREAIE